MQYAGPPQSRSRGFWPTTQWTKRYVMNICHGCVEGYVALRAMPPRCLLLEACCLIDRSQCDPKVCDTLVFCKANKADGQDERTSVRGLVEDPRIAKTSRGKMLKEPTTLLDVHHDLMRHTHTHSSCTYPATYPHKEVIISRCLTTSKWGGSLLITRYLSSKIPLLRALMAYHKTCKQSAILRTSFFHSTQSNKGLNYTSSRHHWVTLSANSYGS